MKKRHDIVHVGFLCHDAQLHLAILAVMFNVNERIERAFWMLCSSGYLIPTSAIALIRIIPSESQ